MFSFIGTLYYYNYFLRIMQYFIGMFCETFAGDLRGSSI